MLRTFASHGTGDGQLTEPHAVAVDAQDRIYVADRTGNRINVYDKDGKFLHSWKQFGRPSGVFVDKNGMIYVADSQSDEKTNPGCKMGIRIGSVKDGKVMYYIAPPAGTNDKTPPPEGIAVDSHGNIYAAAVQMSGHQEIREIVVNRPAPAGSPRAPFILTEREPHACSTCRHWPSPCSAHPVSATQPWRKTPRPASTMPPIPITW